MWLAPITTAAGSPTVDGPTTLTAVPSQSNVGGRWWFRQPGAGRPLRSDRRCRRQTLQPAAKGAPERRRIAEAELLRDLADVQLARLQQTLGVLATHFVQQYPILTNRLNQPNLEGGLYAIELGACGSLTL